MFAIRSQRWTSAPLPEYWGDLCERQGRSVWWWRREAGSRQSSASPVPSGGILGNENDELCWRLCIAAENTALLCVHLLGCACPTSPHTHTHTHTSQWQWEPAATWTLCDDNNRRDNRDDAAVLSFVLTFQYIQVAASLASLVEISLVFHFLYSAGKLENHNVDLSNYLKKIQNKI